MPSPASYTSPRSLGIAASVLLGLTGAAALWNAAAVLALGTSPDSAAGLALLGAGGVGEVLLTAATAVVFIMWLYRVRVNAEVIYPHGHQRGRGWAVGAWFLPFVNLYLPWRITTDVWQASGPAGEHGVPQPVPATVVNAWWSTWIAGLLLARMPAQATVAASEFCTAAAAVLAILVVRRLTAMQERHAQAARAVAAFPAYWAPAGRS
ncbi:DUF4328 domain-containing protein [Kitasatospora cineracea]|uniref:DUF4328 domain-containing protein n=1 Tax=Kitasatospora cineracea TaxID=88074 RepID=UPI0036D9A62A